MNTYIHGCRHLFTCPRVLLVVSFTHSHYGILHFSRVAVALLKLYAGVAYDGLNVCNTPDFGLQTCVKPTC